MTDQTKEAWTPGPWMSGPMTGWGPGPCIYRQGYNRPFAQMIKPKEYYTDYPKRKHPDGSEWCVLSDTAAQNNGRYVATPEIKDQIAAEEKANAHLIAAAPELYAAAKLAKEYLVNELEEPGRTVFWRLVDALAKARGEL